MGSIHQRVADLEARGERAALVTVVRAQGSTPREPGAKMIVRLDGSSEGTVGGGTVEHRAIQEAVDAIHQGEARFVELHLTRELGMCCGGQVSLFIEPISPNPLLLIFGAGHVGSALAHAASRAGFRVHVADEREEIREKCSVPEAVVFHEDLDDPQIPFGETSYVMITTHDHALDQRILERAIKKPFCWLGVIGSKRKAALTRERLAHKGFDDDLIQRVRIPVGLAIGAETPEEIAISILAELISVRRGIALSARADGLTASPETKSP